MQLERSCLVALCAVAMTGWCVAPAISAIEPVDPDLIPEGRRLLEYLHGMKGKGVLTGGPACVEGGPARIFHQVAGREPAIRHFEAGFFFAHNPDLAKPLRDAVLHWGVERGGIPIFTFHWGFRRIGEDPETVGKLPEFGLRERRGTFQKKSYAPPLNLERMLEPGTEEYRAFHSDLDVMADYLAVLQEARVPVLWWPIMEADGGWFWWSSPEKPELTAGLYRQMFEHLVKKRGIHNLIWIYEAAHVCRASVGRIEREHGRTPTLEEEIEFRRRLYPGDKYVDIASTAFSNRHFYPTWGWGGPLEDSRKSGYEMIKGIAPGPAANGMLAITQSWGLHNPEIGRAQGPPWLFDCAWGANTSVDWNRFTWNHDYYITLDELPLLREGNVTPNVRITEPTEGVEARGRRLHILGVANDRNGNLERVSVHALQGPWVDWGTAPHRFPVEYLDTHVVVRERFGKDTLLGEAELEPNGRWSFTWENPPAGFHNVVAFARDAKGAVGASNVIRISAGIENLARGKEATATIHQAPFAAAGAVDSDPNTAWWAGVPKNYRGETVVAGPQWLRVDLGEEKAIGAVSVHWWRARASHYTVQVSGDGQQWRDVVKVEDGRGGMDIHRFEPVKTRYVRLHCTQHAFQFQTYCVMDFGVYERLPEQK